MDTKLVVILGFLSGLFPQTLVRRWTGRSGCKGKPILNATLQFPGAADAIPPLRRHDRRGPFVLAPRVSDIWLAKWGKRFVSPAKCQSRVQPKQVAPANQRATRSFSQLGVHHWEPHFSIIMLFAKETDVDSRRQLLCSSALARPIPPGAFCMDGRCGQWVVFRNSLGDRHEQQLATAAFPSSSLGNPM